jgi:cysteine-rich repeat protein
MLNARVAWLSVAGALTLGIGLGQGCSGADQANDASSSGTSVCGDGVVQATEQCDDGNTNDNDACTNTCTLATCGDGVEQAGEECDDGNSEDGDACGNDCTANATNCGNGVPDDGEECDTGGQDTADCNGGTCTIPECGDGYVNTAAGESCEPSELGDCPDCGGGGGGGGGGTCDDQAIYAGIVTNDLNPGSPGSGIGAVWSFGGQKGIQAGIDMCQSIGADHVCTYQEVVDADAKSELAAIPNGTEFWVHRVATTIPQVGAAGMSPPGAGARCNDWEYPTNHIADGEFGVIGTGLGYSNTLEVGDLTIWVDNDSAFTGDPADNHQCGGVSSASDGAPGCASGCGQASPKAILCCYPQCID